jgi:hypothetical protein
MQRNGNQNGARRRGALLRAAAVLCIASSLGACSSLVLHDESRAQLAAGARKAYTDAGVTGIAATEQQNLALLLDEEIKVVRENYSLQADYAALAFANGSDPMGDSYDEVVKRLGALGFTGGVAQVRQLLRDDAGKRAVRGDVAAYMKVFQAGHFTPPLCAGGLPAEPTLPALASPSNADLLMRSRLIDAYHRYVKACASPIKPDLPEAGELGDAYKAWNAASTDLDDRLRQKRQAADELAAATKAYDQRAQELAKLAGEGKQLAQSITSEADRLEKALDKARSLGAASGAQIDAVVQLLTAVAGGDAGSTASPALARATLVAKSIPSLAQDAIDLETKRTAPPISGLLLELQHQTSLADAASKRSALQQERVDVLKAIYEARYAEALRLMDFTDAVCGYALAVAGKPIDGPSCDRLVYRNENGSVTCLLADAPIGGCVLASSWKDRLAASEAPSAKRKLYTAVTSYLQALSQRELSPELAFRELDVRHRETLLAETSAIDAWNSMIAVPLDQLDGYYQGGLKPAEIADLLVKALGFTAITVGVSR